MTKLISLTFALAFAATFSHADFKLADKPGDHLDVLSDGKIIARYMYAYDKSSPERLAETYKPYLHVFDAEGSAPITKGPGGQFTHHRGLFIGWNKLTVDGKTYDRWHMKGGEIVHQKFVEQKADASGASFTSLTHWRGDGEAVILEEERTLNFLNPPAGAYALIEMTSKLKAVAGETKLDGDPEHAGLQFRPANEVDVAKTAYLFPRADADPKKDRDYPWVAESFSLNGKSYSVAYLNHPSNSKDAVTSAYRDYGRFGNWFKGAIPKGGEQTIKVRILVAAGEMLSADAIQKAANSFTGKDDPTPAATTLKRSESKAAAKPKKK